MKNPIKRGLARELNPGTEVGSVTALEGLSQAAVLGDPVKKALGAKTGIVRLSSYTVAKQRIHRRGQTFTAADYRRVQDMLDKGMVLQESATHLQVFKEIDGKIWKAVVKKTISGDELYLQSLHRSNSLQRNRDSLKHAKIEKGK